MKCIKSRAHFDTMSIDKLQFGFAEINYGRLQDSYTEEQILYFFKNGRSNLLTMD